MTRRTGQNGSIAVKGKNYVVRFWQDVPGRYDRVRRSVPICPVKGPGALTKSERIRRAREIIEESGADTPECLNQSVTSLGTTFRQQAEWFLHHAQTRSRRPVKANTATGWRTVINAHLNPAIGALPLGAVGNAVMKELVAKFRQAGLSANSIRDYTNVVKLVVASAVDENGDQLHPRKWNHEFIDMPIIRSVTRRIISEAGLETLLGAIVDSAGRTAQKSLALVQLLAGSGLRIGELLGVRIDGDVSPDRMTIYVRRTAWSGRTHGPKTENAIRAVDLHPDLARFLNDYIGTRTVGFLFATRTGRPVCSHNAKNRWLDPALERAGLSRCGFHALRRFRATWLSKAGTPAAIKRFWMGWAEREVGDLYDRSREDVQYRMECAESVGLGFTVRQLDEIKIGIGAMIGPQGTPIEHPQTQAQAA